MNAATPAAATAKARVLRVGETVDILRTDLIGPEAQAIMDSALSLANREARTW